MIRGRTPNPGGGVLWADRMQYDYFAIRKYERLVVRIALGLDADTAEDVEAYGPTSVLVSLYSMLEGKERALFLIGLGNALEKNASRRALSQMVLFASKQSLEIHDSIDILADWFVKNKMADPRIYEALDTYWRRRFKRGFEEEE